MWITVDEGRGTRSLKENKYFASAQFFADPSHQPVCSEATLVVSCLTLLKFTIASRHLLFLQMFLFSWSKVSGVNLTDECRCIEFY